MVLWDYFLYINLYIFSLDLAWFALNLDSKIKVSGVVYGFWGYKTSYLENLELLTEHSILLEADHLK